MKSPPRFLPGRLLALLLTLASAGALADSHESTRIWDSTQHHHRGSDRYPYRSRSQYVLAELDLRPGDAVIDIGAGDGAWSAKFARVVGPSGKIYAGEVEEKKVEKLKEKYADTPQITPLLIPKDGTGLPENSCDLAFFSQSYHHLNKDGQVDYLEGLRKVIRPTGRVVIIEKYTEIGLGDGTHGTRLSRLVRQAEDAGWVPVRLELITGTYHFIAILAQKDLFPPRKGKERRKPEPPEKATTSEEKKPSPEKSEEPPEKKPEPF